MTNTKSVIRPRVSPALKRSGSPDAVSRRTLRVGFVPIALAVLAAVAFVGTTRVVACPFCSALAPTISDDLATSAAAVLTICESVRQDKDGVHVHRMRVVEIIKGGPELAKTIIEVASIDPLRKIELAEGELAEGELFWHVGYGEDSIQWAFPKPMSREATAYLRGLSDLPDRGTADRGMGRLAYFLRHLRHADDVIATDAYNEFADATLDEITALSDRLDRQWVISQIRDASVPVHRRRLCWTFLSQCGTAADASLFDEVLRTRRKDATFNPGMDAAIGCYLSLSGQSGLARIEKDYLANPNASYVDTFAAVGAIRVHGTELSVFPRERLADALRHVLNQPALADLVISDLARWKDWSAVDRVAELFLEATEETRFVKPAAVLYLKTCPRPAAAALLEKLRAVDAEAVQAAEASMQFYGGLAAIPVPPADPDKASSGAKETDASDVANAQQESVAR